jgi:hypothetical protein
VDVNSDEAAPTNNGTLNIVMNIKNIDENFRIVFFTQQIHLDASTHCYHLRPLLAGRLQAALAGTAAEVATQTRRW